MNSSIQTKNYIVTDGDTPRDKRNQGKEVALKVINKPRPETLRNISCLLVCLVFPTVVVILAIIISIMILQFDNTGITLSTSSSALNYISQ